MDTNEYNLQARHNEEQVSSGLSSVEEANSKVDLRKYHDLDGMSVAKLDLGLWYVENKTKIVQLVYFFIFLLAIFSWSYFFYQAGIYVYKGIATNNSIIQSFFSYNLPSYSYYTQNKAQDLQLYPVKSILGIGNKRDIVAQIKNPNQHYYAHFNYYFLNNNKKIGKNKGFILPNETKNLVSLGQDIPKTIGGMRLIIDDIVWTRVNPHYFGIWDKFQKNHLNFKFTNVSFTPSKNSSLTEKMPLNTLSFHLENNAGFNYWNLPLIISLYSYSDLVSIATYEANDLESKSNRLVNFTWPGNLPNITDIKIIPNLDITKDDIYKDFKAPTGNFR